MHTGQVDAEFRVGPELVRSGQLGPAPPLLRSNPSSLSAADEQTKVFAAAFPTSVFARPLPCLPEMQG